jgi:hypothetical protein
MSKKQPNWRFTEGRRKSLRKAQKVHVALVELGKKVRDRNR